ncbi:MAG: glycosyltransferase family 4 protein [Fibrobacteres bacterium]|nr:glycosyltransferase family 4 protein [Fibrobacterota bacterium]
MFKAAWFSRRFLPAEGGVERFLSHLAGDLGRDFELRIFAQIFSSKADYPGSDDILAEKTGVPDTELYKLRAVQPTIFQRVLLLPCALLLIPFLRSRFYHTLKKFAVNRFAAVYLKKTVKRSRKCAVVHSFAFGGMGLLAKKTAEGLQVPFVITPFMHRGRWGDAPHDIALYNSADAVIALHEQDKDSLKEAGVFPDVIRVCAVGIPPFSGDGVAFREKHNINGIMVLFVGRLMQHKGWSDLCTAVDNVNKSGRNMTLVMIGPKTAESENLEKYISKPFIKYLGQVSEEEKHDAFFACDLFCLPSVSEIFPVSILEAWHCRKPVVVYDSAALRAVVRNGETGKIIDPNSTALEEALISFADKRASFANLGPEGREELDRNFRIARVASWHRDLYEELITSGRESTQFNKRIKN